MYKKPPEGYVMSDKESEKCLTPRTMQIKCCDSDVSET